MSVAECQQRVDSKEFAEWVARERLEPSEPYRSDLRFAYLCWVIADNFWQALKGKGRRPKVEDFFLKFQTKTRARRSIDDVEADMRAWLMGVYKKQQKGRKRGKHRKHSSNPQS